ncbi:hypothetical protein XELAEV_18013384mg [Xenopus laevis]|uniref:SAP domain-containing ribonucleoprotein n=1 Tax=Xenopus laevis TaxID=8355 RepID=A0A974DR83_XENLA|nr:hypothetical protein XELAEV_18013384mg [Xenopus laevis]
MAEIVDLPKLKLAELKQECLARGLEVKGNKSDLISRLQAYLEEHAEEEANEEDVLGEDETEEEEQKSSEVAVKQEEPDAKPDETNAEKKLVKISSSVSETDRLQKRAERFNVPASANTKKASRAIRSSLRLPNAPTFDLADVTSRVSAPTSASMKGANSHSRMGERIAFHNFARLKQTPEGVSMDKLKERAQRFGLSVSPVSKKMVMDSFQVLQVIVLNLPETRFILVLNLHTCCYRDCTSFDLFIYQPIQTRHMLSLFKYTVTDIHG